MKYLRGKYAGVGSAIAGLVVAILSPKQLTDVTHEAIIVGTQWFDLRTIPLVQSYSHQGPLALFVASWWERLAGMGAMSLLLDALLGIAIGSMLWYITSTIRMSDRMRIGFVLLGLSALLGSGGLERGPSPMKLGFLLVLLVVSSYIAWMRSGESYWFFGTTERNWRYLLLTGIGLSLLLYIEILFALPLLVFGAFVLSKQLRDMQSGLAKLALVTLPIIAHSWVWISFFDSRNLLGTWIDTIWLHIRLTTSDEVGRFGLLVFVPIVVVFCYAIYHARGDNYRHARGSWALAIAIIILSALAPRAILLSSPLLVLLGIRWANRRTTRLVGPHTVYYGGLASVALLAVLVIANGRVIRLENGRAELARSYVEQRLIDQSHVLYYGLGAGFYDNNLTPSTSFVDARVFAYDNEALGLVDRLRGENEASSPRFVVVPLGSLATQPNERINEYIDKHYEKTASVDGFDIYKRL
jgi:hypothetical protein